MLPQRPMFEEVDERKREGTGTGEETMVVQGTVANPSFANQHGMANSLTTQDGTGQTPYIGQLKVPSTTNQRRDA